jgi:RNA polymerase sigma-70 factor (ECF subfamily)
MEQMSADVVATLVQHHRRFRDFLERRVGSRATAEELLQAAFVKGLERGSDLRDGENAVAWFYRVLRNALVDFYRHRDAEQRALDRHARETDASTGPDAELHEAVCQCVHGLIPTLKPEYAEILKSVEIDAEPISAVADRLRITAGNASVRLHRARQALKQRLEAFCGTCTEHGCLDCTCTTMAGPTTT